MNSRNWQVPALVLELKDMPSSHKLVTFLVNKDGEASLLKATLFGGAKSKLSSYVLPFYTGTLWLYANPVKDANKIVDFSPIKVRPSIRASLSRIWAASFASEFAMKLKGCISWVLINAFLDGINASSDDECHLGLLRFIWRVASSSGLAPSLEFCDSCQNKIEGETCFDHSLNVFLCNNCCVNKKGSSYLSIEAKNYLTSILNAEPKKVRKMEVSENCVCSLTKFLFRFAIDMAGSSLYSLSPNNPIYSATRT